MGDIGIVYGIYDVADVTTVWADFSNQGNPEVYLDGRWCVQSGSNCGVELYGEDSEIN